MVCEDEIVVMETTREDLEEILLIEKESFPTPWSLELLVGELESPLSRNLVAKINIGRCCRIVGYLNYWLVIDEVHIQNIAVCRDLRRKGVAGLLIAEMKKRSLSEGAVKATLEVRTSNKGALSFYEKMGFRIEGVRHSYYDDTGEDALILWADVESLNVGGN